jgi:hypothetical protein
MRVATRCRTVDKPLPFGTLRRSTAGRVTDQQRVIDRGGVRRRLSDGTFVMKARPRWSSRRRRRRPAAPEVLALDASGEGHQRMLDQKAAATAARQPDRDEARPHPRAGRPPTRKAADPAIRAGDAGDPTP